MRKIILILLLMFLVISCAKEGVKEGGGGDIRVTVVQEPLIGNLEEDINELENLEGEIDESEIEDINFEDITF